MKRALLLLLILLLAGCLPARPAAPTPTLPMQDTPAPPATATVTLASTVTLAPSATPRPSATTAPSATLTSTPPVLSAETARQLALTGRLGGGAITGVALSGDARRVAVLTTLALRLYLVEDSELAWETPTGLVFEDVAFSSDGAQLVARTRGGQVRRWDAESGQPLGEPLPATSNTRAVSLASDGSALITLDTFDQAYVWDTANGSLLQTNNGLAFPFGASLVAVSPGGGMFLNAGIDSKMNFQVRLWESRSGRFLTGLRGLPGPVYDLRFSPDGQFVSALGTRVAGGLQGDQVLYLWRVSDGALMDVVDLSLDVSAHTSLADGVTVLAGTASGKIFLVTFRFEERYTYGFIRDQFFAHEAAVVDLSSSADGLKFASAAADGSVKVWDAQTGEVLLETQVEELSLQTLTSEWVYEQLEVFARPHLPGFALSPAGSLAARTAPDLRAIELVDFASGQVRSTLQIEGSGYYAAPAFSPDGSRLAAVLDDRRIIVWDVESALDVLRITTQHTQPITRLQFSPDGRQIASLSAGELLVWDLETVTLRHTLTAFRTFAYLPDGLWLAADAQEQGVYLIDAATGRRAGFIAADAVNDLAVSPDGARLAVAGYRSPARYQQDNLVYFFDLPEGKRVRAIELSGYPAEVVRVAYSPDGSLVATVDAYGDLYVWSAAGGTLLLRLEAQVRLPASIHFTPDRRTMIVASGDNTMQVFQVVP